MNGESGAIVRGDGGDSQPVFQLHRRGAGGALARADGQLEFGLALGEKTGYYSGCWNAATGQARDGEHFGVVADVKLNDVERGTPLQTYLPFAQQPAGLQWLVVGATGKPLRVAASIEQAIHYTQSNSDRSTNAPHAM